MVKFTMIAAIRTYVVIKCGKQMVRTRALEGTMLSWDQCFIFYRWACKCSELNLNLEMIPLLKKVLILTMTK